VRFDSWESSSAAWHAHWIYTTHRDRQINKVPAPPRNRNVINAIDVRECQRCTRDRRSSNIARVYFKVDWWVLLFTTLCARSPRETARTDFKQCNHTCRIGDSSSSTQRQTPVVSNTREYNNNDRYYSSKGFKIRRRRFNDFWLNSSFLIRLPDALSLKSELRDITRHSPTAVGSFPEKTVIWRAFQNNQTSRSRKRT
jgi:hypothetical protein